MLFDKERKQKGLDGAAEAGVALTISRLVTVRIAISSRVARLPIPVPHNKQGLRP